MSVPRACIYHPIRFDLSQFAETLAPSRSDGTGEGSAAVARFEREFAAFVGSPNCVAFPFARTALYYVLRELDLPAGSEVILPPLTVPPMVEAVRLLGHTPVFVDLDPNGLIFDLDSFSRALTSATRVAVVTYLFGIAGDPRPLVAMCEANGVAVVEDFSHNLGASVGGTGCGTFGVASIYSSSITKTLDTYGGGLAITPDAALAARLREAARQLSEPPRNRLRGKILRTLVWNIATSAPIWTCITFPILRFIRNHSKSLETSLSGGGRPRGATGFEAAAFERFTAQQAEAGLRLLASVEPANAQREANAELLRTALRYVGTPLPIGSQDGRNVYWQCVAFVDDLHAVQETLGAAGIDAATTNLPLVCDGPGCGDSERCSAHPVASRIKNNGLYLPAHPGVRAKSLRKIAQLFIDMASNRQSRKG